MYSFDGIPFDGSPFDGSVRWMHRAPAGLAFKFQGNAPVQGGEVGALWRLDNAAGGFPVGPGWYPGEYTSASVWTSVSSATRKPDPGSADDGGEPEGAHAAHLLQIAATGFDVTTHSKRSVLVRFHDFVIRNDGFPGDTFSRPRTCGKCINC